MDNDQIAEKFNEWVGVETPVTAKMVEDLIWAMTMDGELHEAVNNRVCSGQAQYRAQREADERGGR